MVWSCPPRNFAFSNFYLPGISGIEGAFYEPGSKTVIPRKVCKFEALLIKRWRTTIITGKERQFKFELLPPPLIFWRGKPYSTHWGWWEDSLPLPFVQWLMTSWRSWRSLPIICDMAKVSFCFRCDWFCFSGDWQVLHPFGAWYDARRGGRDCVQLHEETSWAKRKSKPTVVS